MTQFRLLISIIFLLVKVLSYSQTICVTGNVTDEEENGLFAVNIYLDSQKNYGTSTDLEGNFVLQLPQNIIKKGEYLTCSMVGYNQQKLAFDSVDLSIPVHFILFENTQTLNEVMVEGRKSITREFSVKEMDKLKIYLSPLSAADPLKALAILPSSTNTNETANPELRGSEANRTKVFFNGIPVSNPVRNSQINGIGYFSLFNAELIKTESIYPSNPPLVYGNTSAGMIDIETEDELEGNNFQVSASLATIGLCLSKKIKEKSFFQLYGNLAFSEGFLSVNPSANKNLKSFRSDDFGFNYHCKISGNVSLNLYNYFVSESSNVLINIYSWQDNAKATTLRDFTILNIKYQKFKSQLGINLGSNFSQSHFSFGNMISANKQNQFYSSVNYKYLIADNLSIQAGLSNEFQNYNFDDEIPVFYYALSPASRSYQVDTVLKFDLPEAYLYLRWKPVSKVIWGVGIRKNLYSTQTVESFLSLQTNLRYNLNKNHSLLFTAGKYNSVLEPTYYKKEIKKLSSTQYSLEYFYETKKTILNLAAYYKLESGDTIEKKRIKGFEIYYEQYLLQHLKVSISNTLLGSEIYSQQQIYNADNSAGYYLVATCSYLNNKYINISLSWSNHEGKPYTRIAGSTYNSEAGFYQPLFNESLNTEKFNNYNSFNLSMSKILGYNSNSLIVFFSVQNLFNNSNQKGMTYSRDYKELTYEYYQKRSIYFGCMLKFN
jgi:hypothetical protein